MNPPCRSDDAPPVRGVCDEGMRPPAWPGREEDQSDDTVSGGCWTCGGKTSLRASVEGRPQPALLAHGDTPSATTVSHPMPLLPPSSPYYVQALSCLLSFPSLPLCLPSLLSSSYPAPRSCPLLLSVLPLPPSPASLLYLSPPIGMSSLTYLPCCIPELELPACFLSSTPMHLVSFLIRVHTHRPAMVTRWGTGTLSCNACLATSRRSAKRSAAGYPSRQQHTSPSKWYELCSICISSSWARCLSRSIDRLFDEL